MKAFAHYIDGEPSYGYTESFNTKTLSLSGVRFAKSYEQLCDEQGCFGDWRPLTRKQLSHLLDMVFEHKGWIID